MDTLIRAAAAVVTGARHQRAARNGQDGAAMWLGRFGLAGSDGARSNDMRAHIGPTSNETRADIGVVVVCDGCSSGASSEVGARLGATLFSRAVAVRLQAGESPTSLAMWTAARADVAATLAALLERMPGAHGTGDRMAGENMAGACMARECMAGDRAQAISELFLFTIVAAAATHDEAAVWALGDGAYSFGDHTRVLGPFEDNAPPYLAYDLLADPRPAHFEIAPRGWTSIVVATDGATDRAIDGVAHLDALPGDLEHFATPAFVDHPDALRRQLALLARTGERIDWTERRVVRTPAVLQDDCAIAVLHRRVAPRGAS